MSTARVSCPMPQLVAGIKSRILWTADTANGAHRWPLECSTHADRAAGREHCPAGAAASRYLLRQRSQCRIRLRRGKQRPYNLLYPIYIKDTFWPATATASSPAQDIEEREWLARNFETLQQQQQQRGQLQSEERREIAELLIKSQAWDNFMALKFPTVKRYSGEGAESMLAFFWQLLRDSVQGKWSWQQCWTNGGSLIFSQFSRTRDETVIKAHHSCAWASWSGRVHV